MFKNSRYYSAHEFQSLNNEDTLIFIIVILMALKVNLSFFITLSTLQKHYKIEPRCLNETSQKLNQDVDPNKLRFMDIRNLIPQALNSTRVV